MKLLILGAGVYQLPAIKKARQMDIETLVLSIPGNYPGIEYSSRFIPVDTTDISACLAIARTENINGVLSPGTDVAIPTLGAIAEELNLPGPSYQAALRASSKPLMKSCFVSAGVQTAGYQEVRNVHEVHEAAVEIGFPVMLKVGDSSGSRGVERIDKPELLADAYIRCKRHTRLDSMLVEQFIDGNEFGAQAYVADGEVKFIMLHGDTICQTAVGSVPVGHHVPLNTTVSTREDIGEQIQRCVDALGLDNCALNIDLIESNGQIFVLEVGARSGATCLAELVSVYYGFDYYQYMIDGALGRLPAQKFEPRSAAAASLLFSERSGTLTKLPTPAQAKGLVDYMFDYGVGDHIRQFNTGPDRIGHIVVAAETIDEARRQLHALLASMHFDIRAG